MRTFLGPSVFVAVCSWASVAGAQAQIDGLRVGFGNAASEKLGNYKIGNWAPAVVQVRTDKEPFEGRLEISTFDSDDVEATLDRPVTLGADRSASLPIFVKPGKSQPRFQVRLRDANGRVVDSESFESTAGQVWPGAPQSVTLIVTVGRPAGLDVNDLTKRPGYPREHFRIAHVESARELPDRWYGFDAVNYLVLCTADAAELESLDEPIRAAIETWVQQGGHLIVSAGSAWPVVTKLFGPMLPADVDRVETTRQLNDLESYVGQNAPRLQLKSPVTVPHFTNLRGRLMAGVRDLPLAVQGPHGLGTVTVVGLDFDREPFQGWSGATDLWIKLLALPKRPPADTSRAGAWSQRAITDLSSQLHLDLEEFDDVTVVPFQYVVGLVFLYILLIGPADFWLVRRLKRMEWTWITFPIIVAAASMLGYFTARALKTDSVHVNHVDLIDVDAQTGTLRGTSWFTLFSSETRSYAVEVRPDPHLTASGAAGETTDSARGPRPIVSWLGVSEDAIGGMGRRGGRSLSLRGYRFGPDAESLVDVPLPVWSTKSFTARWIGTARPTVVGKNLRSVGTDRLLGDLTNKTDLELRDCMVAFGGRVYRLGTMPINGSVTPNFTPNEDLRGHIARRAAAAEADRDNASSGDDAGATAAEFMPYNLLVTMMFRSRLTHEIQIPANDYFDEIDLCGQLDHHRAIFVARVGGGSASQLLLDGAPPERGVSSAVFLRVLLPVESGPVTDDRSETGSFRE